MKEKAENEKPLMGEEKAFVTITRLAYALHRKMGKEFRNALSETFAKPPLSELPKEDSYKTVLFTVAHALYQIEQKNKKENSSFAEEADNIFKLNS